MVVLLVFSAGNLVWQPLSVVDLCLAHIFLYFERRPFLDYQLGWSGDDFIQNMISPSGFLFQVFLEGGGMDRKDNWVKPNFHICTLSPISTCWIAL